MTAYRLADFTTAIPSGLTAQPTPRRGHLSRERAVVLAEQLRRLDGARRTAAAELAAGA